MRFRGQIIVLAACLVQSACITGDDKKTAVNPTTATVAANPPTVTLTATPSELIAGDNVTLTWISSNASSCAATGSWKGDLPTSGTFTLRVSDAGTQAFVLNCSGSGGSQAAVASVQVNPVSGDGGTGGGGGSGIIVVTLTANPTTVAVGDSTTITWSAQDATSCIANGAWSGAKAPTGSESVVVRAAGYNYYSLSCSGPGGSGDQQIYVQGLQATLTISASETTTGVGQTTTLTWATDYANSCTASGVWSGVKAANGSEVVAVPSTGANVYTLTCSGPGAPVTKSMTATGVVPTVTLNVFPDKPIVGETVTISWDSTYALGCTASQDWKGAQATKGYKTFDVSASGTLNYTIECSNDGGSASKIASATAVAAPALPPATGYMMNARHDGFVKFSGSITLPLTAPPLWSRDLGAQVGYAVIADGLVFVVSANTDGSYGNRLFALSQATGETVWGPIGLPGTYFWNGLTYDNGRLFTLNFDGKVRAFNAATGAALWTQQMPGYWHDAEPVAFGGMVFATGNYGTVAFDGATGGTKWTSPDYGGPASPAVTSEGLYMISSSCAKAFRPVTGENLWTATICGSRSADIATRNGIVYARDFDGGPYMLDAATGKQVGSVSSQRSPAITDTSVITLYSGVLSSTSIATGAQQWTFQGDGSLVSTPIVVNNTVFVGSSSGKVYALDATNGAQQWFGTTAAMFAPDQWNGRLLPGPTAGEGQLVVTGGNTVAAWRLK